MQKIAKYIILAIIIGVSYFMDCMKYLAIYTVCSIHFGVLVSKIFKIQDPRSIGSTNPGATNVFRSNKIAGIITFFLDALKGALCIYAFELNNDLNCNLYTTCHNKVHITYTELLSLICILGHVFPIFGLIFNKTKSAKGIATFFGTISYLFPFNSLIAYASWTTTLILCKKAAISSIIAVIIFSIYSYTMKDITLTYAIILPLIIIYAHRTNLKKIIQARQRKQ